MILRTAISFYLHQMAFLFTGEAFVIVSAAPAPLLIAATNDKPEADYPDQKTVSIGQARRAMDVTWRYFIQHGALKAGTVTQGYCGTDARILDYYSGQGSCLWSLRSLIVALSFSVNSAYWKVESEPLPIEIQSYNVALNVPGWQVVGDSEKKQVTLERINKNNLYSDSSLEQYGLIKKIKAKLTHKLQRPQNIDAKYNRLSYSSHHPFCECIVDNQ